mgnify:CR=1 FL=1
MSKITFAENAWEEYLYWQGQDKKTLRKINSLLKTILRDPFDGDGKPEPLKGNRKGQWSRKINEKDRLVYEINAGDIIVIQCKGHYDDK